MEGQIVAFGSLWGAQWAIKGLKLGHEAVNKAESFLKERSVLGLFQGYFRPWLRICRCRGVKVVVSMVLGAVLGYMWMC